MEPRPRWPLAVFAHNEVRRIGAALDSIERAAGGHPVEVVVLANGCTDRTVDVVRGWAGRMAWLTLVEIDRGDKAHAWNTFVHDILDERWTSGVDAVFFMDGDVRLEADALPLLASALRAAPTANAAGGMPATGRDRDAWRDRMTRHGTLAGNLYALRGRFVDEIRTRGVRMPIGLIGEDWLVSWLVENRLGRGPAPAAEPQSVFHVGAEFSFDSLSPWQLRDLRTYVRRKWRYALRAVQMEMLVPLLRRDGVAAMPPTIEAVYRTGPIPSRLRWIGRDSLWRTAAVQYARRARRA
jgi:glycosyltransferase involved in cell wall biosynthesis